ncbi:hypothetical protein FRC03_008363 [Tulasnella sp. 419]|nr:hypothetical protein FRC03_008363 [Tulasnella sp. 419]
MRPFRFLSLFKHTAPPERSLGQQTSRDSLYRAVAHLDLTKAAKFSKGIRLFAGRYSDVYKGQIICDNNRKIDAAFKEQRFCSTGESSLGPRDLERIYLEILIWWIVQHDHVAELRGFLGPANLTHPPLIISEWYGDPNLASRLVNGYHVEKIGVIRDVVSAIAHIHSKSIVHGDIKPENVLIDGSGRGRVCDFGQSHFVSNFPEGFAPLIQRASPKFAFTLRYASPELLQNRRTTTRSDIWALGCLIMEVFTGRIPYNNVNCRPAVEEAIERGDWPYDIDSTSLPSDVQAAFVNRVSRCWAVDPDIRPSAAQLLEIIEQLINEGLTAPDRMIDGNETE